ncbi:hypothetical protein ACN4EE_08600 [Geminocystis sp. CENA526]
MIVNYQNSLLITLYSLLSLKQKFENETALLKTGGRVVLLLIILSQARSI